MATQNAKEGTNKKARWKPFMTAFNEWCSDAPRRSEGGSPAGIMAEACRKRGIIASRNQSLNKMTDSLMEKYGDMHVGYLPFLGQKYKMPEMLPAVSLCGYADSLIEQLQALAIKVPRTETALISQLRKIIKQEDMAEVDATLEAKPLLQQVILWEFMYLGSGLKLQLQSPEEKRKITSKKVTQASTPLRKPPSTPPKSQDSEEEEDTALEVSSDDEGSLDTEEEEEEHEWKSITDVNFDPDDGSTIVEVEWHKGVRTWEPESEFTDQAAAKQIAQVWEEVVEERSKKGKTVRTPPSESPIQELPLHGRWRVNTPFAEKATSKTGDYILPPVEMSTLLGTVLWRISSTSATEKPGWRISANHSSLVLEPMIIYGYRSLTPKEHGFELLATIPPRQASFISWEEAAQITEVTSLKSCFRHHKKNKENMFKLKGLEGKKVYSLSETTDWPDIAVNNTLEEVHPLSGSHEQEEESTTDSDSEEEEEEMQLGNITAKPRRTPETFQSKVKASKTKRTEVRPNKTQDANIGLTEKFKGMGIKTLQDYSTTASLVRQNLAALVVNAMTNAEKDDKTKKLQVIPEAVRGVESLNPETGEVYTKRTPFSEKINAANRVGNDLETGEDGDAGCNSRRICLTCNHPTFKEHLSKIPNNRALQEQMQDGKLQVNWTNCLMRKLSYAPRGEWQCGVCPAPPGKGSPLLLPAPGSMSLCPGKNCGATIHNGSRSAVCRCPSCGIQFGYGETLSKDLRPTNESKSTAKLNSEGAESRLAYVFRSGGKATSANSQSLVYDLQKLLSKAAAHHASVKGAPPHVFTTRHVKFGPTVKFSIDGTDGMHLRDFGMCYTEILKLKNSADEILKEATKDKLATEYQKAPNWNFSAGHTDDLKIGSINAAFTAMRAFFVFCYGKNFEGDMDSAEKAYTYLVAKEPTLWGPERRVLVIMSIFIDYARRVTLQCEDYSYDQRYAWEKPTWAGASDREDAEENLLGEIEGDAIYPVRPLLYSTSITFLESCEKPIDDRQHAISKGAFGEMEGCASARPKSHNNSSKSGADTQGEEDTDPPIPIAGTKSGAGSGTSNTDQSSKVKAQLTAALKQIAEGEAKIAKFEAKEAQRLKSKLEWAEKKRDTLPAPKEVSLGDPTGEPDTPPTTGAPGRGRGRSKKGGVPKTGANLNSAWKPSTKPEVGDEDVAIVVGELNSLGPQPLGEILSMLCPIDYSSQLRICPNFNTIDGCDHHPLIPCPFIHRTLEPKFWSSLFHQWMMTKGGHSQLGGFLNAAACRTLLSPGQLVGLSKLSQNQQMQVLKEIVPTTLNNLDHTAGHLVPLNPIREGEVASILPVWIGNTAPFQFSLGGMPVERVSIAAVGKFLPNGQGLILLGHLYDMGARIQLADGSWIDNCCVLKALSAMRFSQRPTPNECALAPDFVLLWQLVQAWGNISVETLIQHQHSQYTHLYVECSKGPEEGLPDTCLMLAEAECLKYYHVLMVCQEQDVLTLRLFLSNLVGLRTELWGNSISAQALRDWATTGLPGQHNDLAFNHSVLVICNLVNEREGNLRHAQAFPQEYSLRNLLNLLARAIENKAALVVVAKIGMSEYLKKGKAKEKVTLEEIHTAHQKLQSLLEKLNDTVNALKPHLPRSKKEEKILDVELYKQFQTYEDNTSFTFPLPEGSPPKVSKASGQSTEDDRTAVTAREEKPSVSAQESDYLECPSCKMWWLKPQGDEHDTCTDCKSNELSYLTLRCKTQSTSASWAEGYNREALQSDTPRDLRFHAHYMNLWFYFELGFKPPSKPTDSFTPSSKTSAESLQRIVTALRLLWFKGRASEGPPWSDIERFFSDKLSAGHMGLLKELVLQGADHLYLGPRTGYMRKEKFPLTPSEEALVLKEYSTLVAARRALVFDLNDTTALRLLILGGVRFGPIVVADKKLPNGRVHPTKRRLCNDSTDSNHRKAANWAIRSEMHFSQRTTNTARALLTLLREESEFPHAIVRATKLDAESAFSQVGNTLGNTGLFASCSNSGIGLLNLVVPFGARSSPGGGWEPFGAALITAISMSPRGDTRLTGDKHPPAVRFVDDILTMASHHGNRSEDNTQRIVDIFTQLLGPGGINLIKQGEEGKPQNFKYVFGGLLDITRRTIRVPGAKLQKVFDLMESFLRRKTLAITCHLAQQVRGVIGAFALCCRPLATLILPRLDRITANAAIAHPQLASPPRDFVAAPAFRHETDEEAWKAFRFNIDLFFRLAGLADEDGRQGVLLRSTVEGALPLPSRLVYPGKETRECHRVFCSDAAKEFGSGWCMKTGRYVQFPFTQKEQLLFNKWNDPDCVTINHREHLLTLFLMILLAPEHPGSVICMLLDNEAAEYAQRRQTTGSRHDEQIMATMAVVALLFGITVYGARVTTASNFTDAFTRPDLKCDAEEFIAKFEAHTGIKPVKVDIPDWLRDMGWEPLGSENPQHLYWFDKILKVIDFLVEHHADTIKKFCPAPVGDIRQMFAEALEGAPIRPIHEFIDDFSPNSGPSPQRVQLTKEPRRTTTTHLRQAQSVGEAEWLRANHIPTGESVLQGIDRLLEKQAQKEIALLEVPNPNYQEEKQFPLPMNVQRNPEWIETWKKSRAGVVRGQKCQLRSARGVSMATGFSGLGGWEKAGEGSGHVTIAAFAENNLMLHNRLKRMYPEAIALREIKEYGSNTTLASSATLFCLSLPCVPYSKADPHRSGTSDKLFESNLKEMIESIKTLDPAIALIECAPGIAEKIGKKPSATEIIQDCLPGFFSEVMIVKTAEIRSPITDTQSPSYKQSAVLTLYNKAMFSEKPTVSTMGDRAPPLESFVHLLDTEGIYFKGFCQMPQKDQIDLVFNFCKVQGQPAYVGSIRDAPPGIGEGGFKSRVQCPVLGAMGPYTAAGGGDWVAVQCPTQNASANHYNQASVRQLKPEEVAAIKLIRGLDNPDDRRFMTENPAAAQRMVGNTPSQPLYDAVITQALLHLFTVQRSSGQTALEQWEALKLLTVLRTVQNYPPAGKSGALRHQGITEQSSSRRLDNGEEFDIKLPFKLIETNVLHIVTPKCNDDVSTRFDATTFIPSPFSELGQRFPQLDCIGCGNRNQFYKESVFCFACTTVLLCCFTDEATYEREYIAPQMKDSVYNREHCMLKAVGCHVRTYWPWVLNQLIDRNRCILGRHPLATGQNLGRSIQDFAHMRTGSGSRLGLGFNCGSGLGMETEPERGSVKSEEETYPKPGRTGGGKRELNQQEKQPESGRRRRRSQTKLTEEQKTAICKFTNEIHLRGKDPGTMTKYASYERHWMSLFEQMNWHPLFIDCDTEAEKARRTLFYVSYEVKHHGNLSRTVWAKLSGIAWMFVKNYFANPFLDMPALKYFMRHLAGREPKAVQKLPATPALLEYIVIQLDRTTVSGASCAASLLVAFWFCARACEVFAESENCVDQTRVVCWKDITWREHLGIEARLCSGENISKAEAMTVTLRSSKNALHTCTRTITATPGCEVCAVAAVKNLHAVILARTGTLPNPNEPICQLEPKRWLSRAQVSDILKTATEVCGCNGKNMASHSLRRGGASAYFCAGVPIEDIKIFGRWLSDAYKLYIFLSSTGSIMSKGNVHPTTVTPRFEKN